MWTSKWMKNKKNEWLNGIEELEEKYWETKIQAPEAKRAQQPFSHRKFHMPIMSLNSGLHHERPLTKSLSHDKREYGVGFVVIGIKSHQVS